MLISKVLKNKLGWNNPLQSCMKSTGLFFIVLFFFLLFQQICWSKWPDKDLSAAARFRSTKTWNIPFLIWTIQMSNFTYPIMISPHRDEWLYLTFIRFTCEQLYNICISLIWLCVVTFEINFLLIFQYYHKLYFKSCLVLLGCLCQSFYYGLERRKGHNLCLDRDYRTSHSVLCCKFLMKMMFFWIIY